MHLTSIKTDWPHQLAPSDGPIGWLGQTAHRSCPGDTVDILTGPRDGGGGGGRERALANDRDPATSRRPDDLINVQHGLSQSSILSFCLDTVSIGEITSSYIHFYAQNKLVMCTL